MTATSIATVRLTPLRQPASPTGHRSPLAVPRALSALAERIADRTATVAVVGLGYVGVPLLVAAGKEGFRLIGVDPDAEKVNGLRRGTSHVVDVSAEDLAWTGDDITWEGRAQFSTDPCVLMAADVIVVAVPTPLREGTPDLSIVRTAMADVARTLRPGQIVILESTTYPGTTEEVVRPILEATGLSAGRDFSLAYSPERINPGDGRPLRETPKIVAGVTPIDTEIAAAFYGALVDEVVRTSSPRQAEMAKLIENTFRQVNIALVNELATIAPAVGVDIWEALEAAATKPFGYMPFWPGPGVGGHCIAIDPSYLSWSVEQHLGFGIGFIEHARAVNNRMPSHVVSRTAEVLNGQGQALRGSRLVILGLTYKAGVNDVRESPALNVLQRLVAAGADCVYHDPFVPSAVVGGVEQESVPLSEQLLAEADCVVILTAHPGIDYDAIVDLAPLVFDAIGATRHYRADNVVLL
ncbi:MAG TPA: nucleotide sugar dehydrogenase [Acidimicrobiia bacterium]|jgi:UDP-N-acetyl-D-glucosamine dehydrogenase|nr:nucleotide sugar dehydrogenase [Acidimicrobiia bacterium]